MELKASYQELGSYIQGRFGQPVSFSLAEGGVFRVTYTKRVLFKDLKINVSIRFEAVKGDTVVVGYDAPLGLDTVAGGVLSFLSSHMPDLAAGIHPEDGHRIRIVLSEIEKAKAVGDNIALRSITPQADGLRIEFELKTPKQ